jgi:hypothetical protein
MLIIGAIVAGGLLAFALSRKANAASNTSPYQGAGGATGSPAQNPWGPLAPVAGAFDVIADLPDIFTAGFGGGVVEGNKKMIVSITGLASTGFAATVPGHGGTMVKFIDKGGALPPGYRFALDETSTHWVVPHVGRVSGVWAIYPAGTRY